MPYEKGVCLFACIVGNDHIVGAPLPERGGLDALKAFVRGKCSDGDVHELGNSGHCCVRWKDSSAGCQTAGFSQLSDIRDKCDIEDLTVERAVDILNEVHAPQYKYEAARKPRLQFGYSVQDVRNHHTPGSCCFTNSIL